ncbi:MAG TPA: excinuclease ABC subunit UvrC [Elusimicrobiota bacterium]|nr:excinuclease ABC subunit UvrC [Elusimicrobiota bacterium]
MSGDAAPDREHLPHACGVYIMRGAAMEVLYVGKAIDLAKRVAQYFNPNKADLKNQILAPLVRKIDYIHCRSEREALVWERRLINRHQPFFNSMWKDDKSYPFVKITMEEDFPRFAVVRRKKKDGGAYFGPYPKTSYVRGLIRSLWKRRLFPLRPCHWDFSEAKPLEKRKINSCLYYHTGECPAPCAGKISPDGYRRIAQDAADFFRGRWGRLRKRFEGEMKAASARLEFEEAGRWRDSLAAVSHMGERVRYEEVRPGKVLARLDASGAVSDLQKALKLERPPHRIECFDISHLFGQGTVASMVCFIGGEPRRDQYRRFRLRTIAGIDDFASMAEVVGRRLRRLKTEGSALPDLLLIDGGKGQLSAAERALREVGVRVPVASLAKREEEVFVPGSSDPIVMERDRPALRLLQALRDEAHRFAITYNRLLRKKELLP